VFSGVVGVEKPDPRIYKLALEMAGNIAPEEALHIGDSMRKDYNPARSIGMHALLLDRFKTADAEIWRKSGATVLPDLVATQEWLTRDEGQDFPKKNQEEETIASQLKRMSEKL
jgi:FMN phosphatase YigB (HAD superfamily)